MALNAYLLHYFLVEVIEELFAGVALALCDFDLQFLLELVELELDLLRCAALLVNRGNPLFEADPGLHSARSLVTGAEYAAKKANLFVQKFVDSLIGSIVLIEEVDHHYVELLAVAMAAADA